MIKVILGNVLLRKLIKFSITGGAAFGVSYLIYVYLVNRELKASGTADDVYLIYKTLGDIAGLMVSFLVNKYWTFRHQRQQGKKYFTGYFMVYFITFFLNIGITKVIVDYLTFLPDLRLYFAPIISTGICAVINFLATNNLVFKVAVEDEKNTPEA